MNLYTRFFCLISCSLFMCFFKQMHFLMLMFTFLAKTIQTVKYMPFWVKNKIFQGIPQPDYTKYTHLPKMHVCPSALSPICVQHLLTHEHCGCPTRCGSSAKLKASMLMSTMEFWGWGRADIAERTHFPFETEHKERLCCSKKHEQPRNPTPVVPLQQQSLILIMMTQRERESQGNPCLLSFSVLPYSSAGQRSSVRRMPMQQEPK